MKKIRMGIIGAGGIARDRHLPAYHSLSERVELTAVFDVNRQTAEQVSKDFEIPFVTDTYEEMFSMVDAVTIATPNKFHAEISIAALKAGVHVLCEKPMAMNVAECEAMEREAKENGKVLSIAYHYRYTKEAEAAKSLIEAEEVGAPLVTRIRAMRRRKVPGWGVFTNKELQGGGCLIDFGCHFIDLALWLMDYPKIVEVAGSTYQALSRMPDQVNEWGAIDPNTFNVDDHCTGFIRFANGSTLLLETSWAANIKEDEQHLSISGTNGGVGVDPLEFYGTKQGMIMDTRPTWIPGEEDPGLKQIKHFLDSITGDAEPRVTPHQALETTRIIDAIYKSSDTGKSVHFHTDMED